ncbi:MAG: hypothetical protein IT303_19955 [Dehalococcoidia bacterium]|nr:hypothetical protein [Dehalococcoidia bacterium]
MADRIEREIEEILARLDQEEPLPAGEKKPVSIMAAKAKRSQAPAPPRAPRPNPLANVNLTSFLIAGAAMVLGGLILASFWEPLIWASFAGVVVFLGAFAMSFFRSRPAGGGSTRGGSQGVYWRDRYIQYEPASASTWQRIKRRFRR